MGSDEASTIAPDASAPDGGSIAESTAADAAGESAVPRGALDQKGALDGTLNETLDEELNHKRALSSGSGDENRLASNAWGASEGGGCLKTVCDTERGGGLDDAEEQPQLNSEAAEDQDRIM